jgi:hypothetical protein
LEELDQAINSPILFGGTADDGPVLILLVFAAFADGFVSGF